MKRLFIAIALALSLPSAALCAPQPWAKVHTSFSVLGLTITLAQDTDRVRSIAVMDALLLSSVSGAQEKRRWTTSETCPGLDRLATAVASFRTMKRTKPRLEGPRDGEFIVTFLPDSQHPQKVLGGKGHGAKEEAVLEKRLQPLLDDIDPCWVDGDPPPEVGWRNPEPAK